MNEVSALDVAHYRRIRDNVSEFLAGCPPGHDRDGALVLDVAPQVHEGARAHFALSTVETLDIDPGAGTTYVADLCTENSATVPGDRYDCVVCTEVLEHTLQPFAAVREVHRLLKPGGHVFVSCPFNFRIHGPLPDCWRFTEHGLRALFQDFDVVSLEALDDPERFLMPVHYTLVARKRVGAP